MATHTAGQVAKWLLAYNRIAEDELGAEKMSNLKLQKLLYYAQGAFLATTDVVLFDDPILAWMHGPVVETVYKKYGQYYSDGIPFDEDFDFSAFTSDESDLLQQVFHEFGQFAAWKLRKMTCQEAPWRNTKRGDIISVEAIMNYFKNEYLLIG